jgi:hypothetical protein
VTNSPGFVAFWDFVKREPGGAHRFTAHVPLGATNDYPLDAANYIRDFWGEGREATYADFPLLGRGPFGQAIRIVKETDPNFRPFLFVPRSGLHDTPLDIKGTGKSVSVVVWAIRESGNHALAGIWHEGTDLNHAGAAKVVARGQRQYALFAGLNKEGSACGHVSENGAKSFGHIYAMHKSNPVIVLSETFNERVELQEFGYTRVTVTRRKEGDGIWTTTARDLADVRLNPWWYPHDSLYTPANDGTGGPFTIGRAIHSSRSVGFTGWIGGVAVFHRALSAEELSALSAISRQNPIAVAK